MVQSKTLRATGVLVLGDHRQSLAVARSLHRAGYRVIAGRADRRTILEHSRHVAEVWKHPPSSEPLAWTEALETFCGERDDVGVVFPVGDAEIYLTAPLAGKLPVLVVAVSSAILAVCRSKRTLLGLAADAGVPTQTWEAIERPDQIMPALGRIGLPAALKPDLNVAGFKAAILRTEADARRFADRATFPPCGYVLQQLAHGPRHNVYFVAREGRLMGHAEVRILRTDRLDGTGLGVEGESVSPNASLLAWTKALAARLSYTGAGCAQFVVDERTGTACFLEINARLGANCAAVCACGLDLPRLFVEAVLGTVEPQPPEKIGRRYAWLTGDLNGIAHSLRSGNLTWTGAAAWLGRAALAQVRAQDHITWTWRDPVPTLTTFGPLIQAGVRKLLRPFTPELNEETKGTKTQAWSSGGLRWFGLLYAPAILLLAAIAMVAAVTGTAPAKFTLDPSVLADAHPLLGMLSNLGILVWTAAAAICLFTARFLPRGSPHGERGKFLLSAGLLTAWLLLDDFFLFHEKLGPEYAGIPQPVILATYVGLVAFFLLRFGTLILRNSYLLLGLALGLFAGSVAIDQLPHTWFHEWTYLHLIEDGFKFLGIVGWFGYFGHVCARFLEDRRTDPHP